MRVESGCEGGKEAYSGLFVGTNVNRHKGEAEAVVSGEVVVVGVVIVLGLRE